MNRYFHTFTQERMLQMVLASNEEDANLFCSGRKIIIDSFDENKDVDRRPEESNYSNEFENSNLLQKQNMVYNVLHDDSDEEQESS